MAATTTPPSANFSFNALALTGQLFHHHSSNWGEWRQKPWHSWGWGKFGTLELTGYDASTWCGRIRRERQPTLTTMLPTPHALFFYLCVVLRLWGLDLRAYLHWHVRQWAYRSSRCGSVDMSRFISRIGFFYGTESVHDQRLKGKINKPVKLITIEAKDRWHQYFYGVFTGTKDVYIYLIILIRKV